MSVRVHERLTLDDMTIEQSRDPDDAPRFVVYPHGVEHVTDSLTGKRRGDSNFYPMHRVRELQAWRVVHRG